jgi:uncharacterized protein YndB with AHSA1/START domain
MRIAALALIVGLALAAPAAAEVLDSQPNGFEVRRVATIDAPAAKVWDALGHIGAWWDPAHTYSRDARNLSIELKAGACWCETTSDGAVEHMRVVYVAAPKAVRLEGALGPLQSTGASGHMAWSLAEKDGRATLTWTYDVGGYAKGGLGAVWAAPVDNVLGEQVARLKRYVESGKPD